VIFYNGARILRPSIDDLMDRTPGAEVVQSIRQAANDVPGVLATEKLAVRKSGMVYRVTIHVQADPTLPLADAHVLGGMVKGAIRLAVPRVQQVLVHMEPHVKERMQSNG
jgi:divalent metal cation (Fe/Co/Zn/Cd) transporter